MFGDTMVAATKLNAPDVLARGGEVQDFAHYPLTHRIDSHNKELSSSKF